MRNNWYKQGTTAGPKKTEFNASFLDGVKRWFGVVMVSIVIISAGMYVRLAVPEASKLTEEVAAVGLRMAEIQQEMEQVQPVRGVRAMSESIEPVLTQQQIAEQQVLMDEWRDAVREWQELEPLTSRTHRLSIHEVFSQQRTDLNLYVGGVVVIIGVIGIVATLLSVGMTLSLSVRGDELSRQSDAAEKAVETQRMDNERKMQEALDKFTTDLQEKYKTILTSDEQLAKIKANEMELTALLDKMKAEIASFKSEKDEIQTFLAQLPNEEGYKQLVQEVERLKGQALDVERLEVMFRDIMGVHTLKPTDATMIALLYDLIYTQDSVRAKQLVNELIPSLNPHIYHIFKNWFNR